MSEIFEYYVVGIYESPDEPPVKIYKVTPDIDEAFNVYFNYIKEPKCFIGLYYKNSLTSLGQYKDFSCDGPGIFKQAVITTDDIINYKGE